MTPAPSNRWTAWLPTVEPSAINEDVAETRRTAGRTEAGESAGPRARASRSDEATLLLLADAKISARTHPVRESSPCHGPPTSVFTAEFRRESNREAVSHSADVIRRPALHRRIGDGTFASAWAVDDGAALVFRNGAYVETVASRRHAAAYRVRREPDGSVREERVAARYLG